MGKSSIRAKCTCSIMPDKLDYDDIQSLREWLVFKDNRDKCVIHGRNTGFKFYTSEEGAKILQKLMDTYNGK